MPPRERKTKDELAAEARGDESENESGPSIGDFEAFSEEERAEANELITFLQENGWITYGSYSLDAVPSQGEEGYEIRKGVTLSVWLPSTLNFDPEELIDDD